MRIRLGLQNNRLPKLKRTTFKITSIKGWKFDVDEDNLLNDGIF
jgi:hypothetical protein